MNIQDLEKQYLDAKITYYEGHPIMEDSEFDFIERLLKEHGSKVVEQVGSKRKDFDYALPTPMLSLGKIQTEEGYLATDQFTTWFRPRAAKLLAAGYDPLMYSSCKFDGNAIDCVFNDGKPYQVLTRGDGLMGKNVTDRLGPLMPKVVGSAVGQGTLEVRCEVVIRRDVFVDKYSDDFANPRNFVAGILGGDSFDDDVIADLTIVPLHFLLNGENVARDRYIDDFRLPAFYVMTEDYIDPSTYEATILSWIGLREGFPFQLDGVVISFYPKSRHVLGENDHDPEWAIAIKLPPQVAISEIIGVEWNVGKTGELSPVVLLKPVNLAGTVVKRASAYNAGYIVNKGIRIGTVVSVCKRGDIIPAIQSIISNPG